MPAMELPAEELKLNRQLQNAAFQSWRLKHGSVRSRSDIDLPLPVATVKSDAVDYLHTRARVLHNHLLESRGRLFCFLGQEQQQQGALKVVEACCSLAGEQAGCTLRLLAELDSASCMEVQACVEAKVDPSLAVVDTSALSTPSHSPAVAAAVADAAAAAGAESVASQAPSALQGSILVTSGSGEVRLLHRNPAAGAEKVPSQPMLWSSAVSPLPPLPPMVGQRPLVIEAAYAIAPDTLRFVAWAVKSPVDRPPAPGSQRPQHAPHTSCETFVITLKLQPPSSSSTSAAGASATVAPSSQGNSPAQPGGAASGQLQLAVTDVRLLRVSALPPHLVMANPVQDMLLLGLDPEGAAGAAGQQQEDVMHIDCTKTANAPSTSAMDEDDDIDPRTLAEAAARLAKYTTDDPDDVPLHQQWTDIYKESGPDGVGAMGGEPSLDFVALSAASSAAAAGTAAGAMAAAVFGGGAAGSGGAATAAALPPAAWHLSCGANRLLSCEGAGAGLLGLSDDVDCAVVSVSWPHAQRQPRVVHEAYVPALAYVAAGKVHKKHLLLGRPHSGIAAVLVEGQRMYYVYRRTAQREESGLQDIVEMQLCEGESVLGARLVELAPPQAGDGASTGADAADTSAAAAADAAAAGKAAKSPGVALLLLTQSRLLLHHLTAE